MIAMIREMAAPKFQSPLVRNCVSMTLPTSTYWPPPSSLGMKKLDTAEEMPYLELVGELMKQGYAAEQVAAAALQMPSTPSSRTAARHSPAMWQMPQPLKPA